MNPTFLEAYYMAETNEERERLIREEMRRAEAKKRALQELVRAAAMEKTALNKLLVLDKRPKSS